MSISTYNELRQAIINWSKRSDNLSVIDDFIALAEADMWEELRVRDMEVRATATLSGRFIALPDGYLQMRKLRIYTGSTQYDVNYRAPESITVATSSGLPTDYTITSQIEFNKAPSGTYTIEMQYYKSLDAVTSANQTSAILTRFPMVYLYGALFHYAQWAQDDEMLSKYSTLFHGAIQRANRGDKKGRHGAAKAMKIETPTP